MHTTDEIVKLVIYRTSLSHRCRNVLKGYERKNKQKER